MNLIYNIEYNDINNKNSSVRISLNLVSGRFYIDRLTHVEESRKKKYYYMGWKTVRRRNPTQDGNYSSSKVVKSLIKK